MARMGSRACGDPAAGASGDEQLIGALIPPATRRRPASAAPLLPSLPAPRLPVREDPQAIRLDVSRPDASGRLSIRHLLRALGWSAGNRIDHTVVGDAIVITRSATGRGAIGARGDLLIPSAVRALAGLHGDRSVLLVAAPAQGALVVHAESVVADLIAEYYVRLGATDDR